MARGYRDFLYTVRLVLRPSSTACAINVYFYRVNSAVSDKCCLISESLGMRLIPNVCLCNALHCSVCSKGTKSLLHCGSEGQTYS